MANFFARNLELKGRVARAIVGGVFVAAGWVVGDASNWLAGSMLILSGGFMWLEAVSGWCVVRACGIKTKL